EMHRAVRDKPSAPNVKCCTEWGRARSGLGDISVGTEAKVGSADRDRRALRMLRRCDVAVLAEIGAIDPVVDAKPWIRDAILSIHFGKSSIQDLPNVGFTVAVCIFHEENIWRASDN